MIKRSMSLVIAALSLVTVGSAGLVHASNNHTDTSWDAILPRNGGNYYTGARNKTDKSRTYVRVNEVGKGMVNVWAQKSDGVEIGNPKYSLKAGQYQLMYNRAYEIYGKTKIRLAIESREGYVVHVHASGVWSPDSVKKK